MASQPEYTPISTSELNTSEPGAEIELMQANNNTIKLNFFFADSSKKEYMTSLDCTINEVKQLAFTEYYSTSNIRMIFHGRSIEDHLTLRQCDISENDNNIHVSITDREAPIVANNNSNNNNSAFENFSILISNNDNDVNSDQSLNEGTRGDFMCGVIFGFILGPIMCIWLWQPLPRRQKLGIIFGVIGNIILSIMQQKQVAQIRQDGTI